MIQIKKQVKQEGKILTERKTFLNAFYHWHGRNFLTKELTLLSLLKPHNFAHVLSKKNYRWFKYYLKNIVILTLPQHVLFDNYTEEKFKQRIEEYPEEKWEELFLYEIKMKEEYTEWIKKHPKEYKL